MNDRLRDFIQVSKKAFNDTGSKIRKSYLVFAFILLGVIFDQTSLLSFFRNGTIVGILTYIISVIILCFVVQSLKSVVVYGNSGKKSIENSVNNFFGALLSAIFYLYLIKMLVNMITVNATTMGSIVVFVIMEFLTSALLEEVYIGNKTGFEAIRQSCKFVVDNLLTYGLYSIIFIILEYYLTYKLNMALAIGSSKFIIICLVSVVRSIFYIFRGHLFKYLDSTPYRQRKFMRG